MSYSHVSRHAHTKLCRTLDLFESFVVHETGGVLGDIELPFLYVLSELPTEYQSTITRRLPDHSYIVVESYYGSLQILRGSISRRSESNNVWSLRPLLLTYGAPCCEVWHDDAEAQSFIRP